MEPFSKKKILSEYECQFAQSFVHFKYIYWVGKKFFAFFSKISWNGRERSRIFHIRSKYRWYEYCSNDNEIIEMEVDLELEMKLSRRELRLLLLHEFRLGRKATEATSNTCGTMGKAVLTIRTAQHWFHRFKNGNFEFDDLPHSGRLLQVDMDLLKELIEQDPRLTTRCLAERLGCSHITNRNTSARIRQNVEIQSLDTS